MISIRDDMYIGKGNAYMHQVWSAVTQGYRDGILEQKPTLVNLQCDIDHPTSAWRTCCTSSTTSAAWST